MANSFSHCTSEVEKLGLGNKRRGTYIDFLFFIFNLE